MFLPLLRYALENPDQFWNRAASRAFTANPLPIFFSNLWNALRMFNVNDGNIFVNSIVHRPALDVVTGALFVLGLTLLLVRRRFLDLWLVAAILTLILPSVFSLAFPDENPALNRAGGALVPVFVVVGMTLDGLLTRLQSGLNRSGERVIVAGVVGILFAASAIQNYDLVFRQYDEQYQRVVWRTSEMGAVIEEFFPGALAPREKAEERATGQHLHDAEAEDLPAQRPELPRPHLEADQEQEQHHPELGDVQDRLRVAEQPESERPDQESRAEVAEHCAEAEPAEQGHGDDRGGEQRDRVAELEGGGFRGHWRLQCRATADGHASLAQPRVDTPSPVPAAQAMPHCTTLHA